MSGQYVTTGTKAFTVGASDVARYLRVKTSSGLVTAGATDKELGVTTYLSEDGTYANVLLRTAQGTVPMTASGAITADATVYTAASGKISATQGAGSYEIGTALEAATADGDIIEVLRAGHVDLST